MNSLLCTNSGRRTLIITPKFIEIVLIFVDNDEKTISMVVENDKSESKENIAHFFEGFMPKESFWPSEYELPNVLSLVGNESDYEPQVRIKEVNCSKSEKLSLRPDQYLIDTKFSAIYEAGCTPQWVMNF